MCLRDDALGVKRGSDGLKPIWILVALNQLPIHLSLWVIGSTETPISLALGAFLP